MATELSDVAAIIAESRALSEQRRANVAELQAHLAFRKASSQELREFIKQRRRDAYLRHLRLLCVQDPEPLVSMTLPVLAE